MKQKRHILLPHGTTPSAGLLRAASGGRVRACLLACFSALALPALAQVPATPAYVLTPAGELATITLDAPGTPGAPTVLTGVEAGDTLVAMDVRPQNQALYALGVNATADTVQLYRLSPQTGQAVPLGSPDSLSDGLQTVDLPDTTWDIDFNPAVDRVRVMSQTGLNFRMNPNNGALVDGDPLVLGTNPDGAANDGTTTVSGTAYTNSTPNNGGITTQYTLDSVTDSLYIQNPPNNGNQTMGIQLTLNGNPLDFASVSGFDIAPGVATAASNTAVTAGVGYAVLTVGGTGGLYQIDLTTAAVTLVGALEARSLAINAGTGGALGLDEIGLTLVRFNPLTPEETTTAAVTGVTAGETLVAVDYRPATGQLYALGINPETDTGSIYLVDPQLATVTVVGIPGSIAYVDEEGDPVDFPPVSAGYDIDFNPTVDRMRIVTGTGLNMRANQITGTPVDGNQGGAADSVAGINTDGSANGGTTTISATAYTNSFNGTAVTTQYTLDATTNSLYIQNPPNVGTQTAGVPVTLAGGAALDFAVPVGFDILSDVVVANSSDPATGVGYFTATDAGGTQLYRLDLTSGVATSLGTVSVPLSSLAMSSISSAPLVTMPTVADIGPASATLGGTVTEDGGSAITERGVVYAITADNATPEIDGEEVTKVIAAGTTTGTFTTNVTGLETDEPYTFRAYAINAAGVSYSDVASFTPVLFVTEPVLPDAVVSQEYAVNLNLPEGTTATVKGLPPGLKLDRATGVLSGRISSPGVYQISVTVKAGGGISSSYITTLTVQALPNSAVGTYVGYIQPNNALNSNLGGRVDVKTTTKGSFTVKMIRNGKTVSGKGFLTTSVGTTPLLNVLLKDGTVVNLTLESDDTLDGQISISADVAPVTGWRKVYDRVLTPASQEMGYYTVALEAGSADPQVPQGHGFAAITIGLDGSTKVVGKAADGSTLTTTAFLGTDGEILVYAPLAKKQGSISGMLEQTNGASGDIAENSIEGILSLTKPATTGRLYPAALTLIPLNVEGKYMARAAKGIVLGLPAATPPSSLIFTGGGIELAALNPSLVNSVRFPRPTLKPVVPALGSEANPARTTLAFKPATGALTGSFKLVDGSLKRTVKFQAMLVRSDDGTTAKGYFLLPQIPVEGQTAKTSPILSGRVELLPELLTF
ncbi:DUF4394 domain-containing protein [Prosthecobacter sp. SYSU 5D2]|uniref:DUF4394 domain-containing protein n=1 Tax=Prosthecobacter sp. SYSU 5D2 TaxID=3134134 RepID=UPI0031FEB068